MSNEQVTASFILTKDLKEALEVWAAQNDRTQSAELRRILAQEIQRRKQQQQQNNAN